jgi:aldehyde dehydrogenase (NAD+)
MIASLPTDVAALLPDVRGGDLRVRTPIDGSTLGHVRLTDRSAAEGAVAAASAAFLAWRRVPAPQRGDLVRLFGEELRTHRTALAALVTLETGKIVAEAYGEVQEMIDMCDFAVGLSRQLHGLTMASERRGHRLMELWHPLGPIGVITAFNFPVAVWAWNFALAIVCGDAVIWKPSEKTPMSALACQSLFLRACQRFGDEKASALSHVIIGGRDAALGLCRDPRLPLISATGSCRMGREVAPLVSRRFGRLLLELGGNNGAIVTPSANLDLTVRGVLFATVGTAGQRCTSLRRLFVHEEVAEAVLERLRAAFERVPIGDPRDSATLVGPLIDLAAAERMDEALKAAVSEGGRVFGGGRVYTERWPQAAYVRPAIVEMPAQTPIVHRETFAPILYVLRYTELEEAIALHNAVPQGLSSAMFTRHLDEAERFLSADGSDCGLVNINAGPSGAEIGGAFGGEKETGGGREAGSDAWKQYMRRLTVTINGSNELPLAQGVVFDVP